MIPPPEDAEATAILRETIAKCVLDHMGMVASDRAAEYVVISGQNFNFPTEEKFGRKHGRRSI
jgi:hypothetical protein